jgi:SAM-dependent methyltransferase
MQGMLAVHPPTESGTTLRVLDIGCGYGEMLRFLNTYRRPKGYHLAYKGIDADPVAVELANGIAPQADIQRGELPQALEGVGTFQGFICSEVLEHLTQEQGLELFRLMTIASEPGSVAVFTVPTPELSKVKQFDFHLHEYPVSEVLRLIEDSGWKLITWYWLRVPITKLPTRNLDIPNIVFTAANAPFAPKDQNLTGGKDAFYFFEKV